MGISTRAPGGFHDYREHIDYGSLPYREMFIVLDKLMLRPNDVFVDIGCGRGRALCCAARYGVSQVIGIEDVADLAAAAQRNLRLVRHPRNFPHEIICGKAQNLDYSPATAIYMYNPFGPSATREVIDAIGKSLERRPRPLRIAYVNPWQESVMADAGWLERYDHWGPECLPGHRRIVSFWRSVGHP